MGAEQRPRGAFDPVADRRLGRSEVHEPPARPRDGEQDAEVPEQRGRPRSGRDHHDVGVQPAVVGDHPGHPLARGGQASRRQVVADRRPVGSGQVTEQDRERQRIHAATLVEQPRLDDLGRERRLELADRVAVEPLDVRADAGRLLGLGADGGDPRRVQGDRERADRLAVQVHGHGWARVSSR
jgi:hypothetical protein